MIANTFRAQGAACAAFTLVLLALVACDDAKQPSKAESDPANASAGDTRVVDASSAAGAVYTCPMHPEVASNEPGKCSKCGMALVPKTAKGR